MHKKIKLFVFMLAAAAMLVLLPGANALNAKAEGNTYSLKYIGEDVNAWRYVPGSTFEEGMYHKSIYSLTHDELKDGDHIVIYAGDVTPSKGLDLSGFKLESLTIYRDASIIIYTGGVKDCYVLAGAYAAINGDVTNANLYDNTTCTFNNNVLDIVLHIKDEPHSNIACAGTVGMFQILEDNTNKSRGVFYDIPNNTMNYVNGTIQFPNWSYQPTEAYLQARAAADETAAGTASAGNTSAGTASTGTASAGNTPSDEYDKVPKTGDGNNLFWLISLTGAAAVLFAGSYMLYRKTK